MFSTDITAVTAVLILQHAENIYLKYKPQFCFFPSKAFFKNNFI